MYETACLLIDDLSERGERLTPWAADLEASGVRAAAFSGPADADLYGRLQAVYQRLRMDAQVSGVIGLGTGGAAALALAAHLPVQRLVLIERAPEVRPEGALRRLARFAAANAALCVSDVLLIVPNDDWGSRRARALRRSLTNAGRLEVARCGAAGTFVRTDCKNGLFEVVQYFLRAGELPKCLAENAEMCIIYG